MVEHGNKIRRKLTHLLFLALFRIGTIKVLARKCQHELPLALQKQPVGSWAPIFLLFFNIYELLYFLSHSQLWIPKYFRGLVGCDIIKLMPSWLGRRGRSSLS